MGSGRDFDAVKWGGHLHGKVPIVCLHLQQITGPFPQVHLSSPFKFIYLPLPDIPMSSSPQPDVIFSLHALPPNPAHTQAEDSKDSWYPFRSCLEFNFAWQHFVKMENSKQNINKALDIWAASVVQKGGSAAWKNADELYACTNKIQHGDAPWTTHIFHYQGWLLPSPPLWMTWTYELCVHDTHHFLHQQFANPSFKNDINYVPYQQFIRARKRVWMNFMSGD